VWEEFADEHGVRRRGESNGFSRIEEELWNSAMSYLVDWRHHRSRSRRNDDDRLVVRKAGPNESVDRVWLLRQPHHHRRGTGDQIPWSEAYRTLSLELMSFDVAPQQTSTHQGVAVTVEAVAQIKVKSDDVSIRTAAEQFLSKSEEERQGLIRLVMEGHSARHHRAAHGRADREGAGRWSPTGMRSTCADDMNKMGLEVVSFTIKEVRDQERVHRQHGTTGRGAHQA